VSFETFISATWIEVGNTSTHWSHEITAEKLYLILALGITYSYWDT